MKKFEVLKYRSHFYDDKSGVLIVKTLSEIRYFNTFYCNFYFTNVSSQVLTLTIRHDDAFEGYIQINRR